MPEPPPHPPVPELAPGHAEALLQLYRQLHARGLGQGILAEAVLQTLIAVPYSNVASAENVKARNG
jgi:hypothetical protein